MSSTSLPVRPARAPLEVRYSDEAIAKLAGHLARQTPGVARLQPLLVRRLGARARDVAHSRSHPDDLSAVAVSRAADGSIEVSIRVVTTLRPPPVEVVRMVGLRVSAEVGAATGRAVWAEITIGDVEP